MLIKREGKKLHYYICVVKIIFMSPWEQAYFAKKNEGEQMKEKMGLKRSKRSMYLIYIIA